MTKRIGLVIFGLVVLIVACKHYPNNADWGTGPYSPVTLSISCDPDTIYFQEQVFPIFYSSCAVSGCHDATTHREGLILDSYFNIMSSGEIVPGNHNQGDITEALTDSGEDLMPPPNSGGPLSSAQINLIYAWIDQGAQNNSCPNAVCDTLDVTFSGDIWPIVESSCTGCHSGSSPSGSLSLTNYNQVYASINNNPTNFISLIDGTGSPVMPVNTNGLPSCQVRMFEIWIENQMPND